MKTATPARVLLVRHGRTALNAEGRLRGLADPELDDIGRQRAGATAAAPPCPALPCPALPCQILTVTHVLRHEVSPMS